MSEKRFPAFRAACVYSGTILGAGFASGQELVRYFTRFGAAGFPGLLLMGAALALGGWAALDICTRRGLDNASALMESLFGKRLGTALGVIVGVFIFVVFCAVVAGGGAMAREAFGLPYSVGVLAVAGICFVIFLFDLRGIVRLNMIVSPMLVVGGVFFGLYTAAARHAAVFGSADAALPTGNWMFSAGTYAAYNLLTAISVLAGMRGGGLVTDARTARRAGLLGGGLMCLLGACFALPLYLRADLLAGAELPLHRLAQNAGGLVEAFYLVLLAAAILASAVSNGFSAVAWLQSRLRWPPVAVKALVAFGGAAAAHIGFSALVSRVYPLFGFVGFFVLAGVLIGFIGGRRDG